MNKENVVYVYRGVLFGLKKEEILSFVTMWMKLEGITLSEMSDWEKQYLYVLSLICET